MTIGLIILAVFFVKYVQATNEKSPQYPPATETHFTYSSGALIKPNPVVPDPEPSQVAIKYGIKKSVVEMTLLEKARFYKGKYMGSCVEFAKKLLGITEPLGFAGDIQPNVKDEILVGDLILINHNHVGVLVDIYKRDDGLIVYWVADSNGDWQGSADLFEILSDDKRIRGFFRP